MKSKIRKTLAILCTLIIMLNVVIAFSVPDDIIPEAEGSSQVEDNEYDSEISPMCDDDYNYMND